jgi:hypothetical protein
MSKLTAALLSSTAHPAPPKPPQPNPASQATTCARGRHSQQSCRSTKRWARTKADPAANDDGDLGDDEDGDNSDDDEDGDSSDDDEPDQLVPDPVVCREFHISAMTLWRWDRDAELAFPPPVVIRKRKFRVRRALEAFKARLRAIRESW